MLPGAAAHGVGTANDLIDYFRLPVREAKPLLPELVEDGRLVECRVEGWDKPAYRHPDVAPARDRCLHAVVAVRSGGVEPRPGLRLFDFHYRIEIYVPHESGSTATTCCRSCSATSSWAAFDLKTDRTRRVLEVGALTSKTANRRIESRRGCGRAPGARRSRLGPTVWKSLARATSRHSGAVRPSGLTRDLAPQQCVFDLAVGLLGDDPHLVVGAVLDRVLGEHPAVSKPSAVGLGVGGRRRTRPWRRTRRAARAFESLMSCTLHDVQLPQSASASITASQLVAISWRRSTGAGLVNVGLA